MTMDRVCASCNSKCVRKPPNIGRTRYIHEEMSDIERLDFSSIFSAAYRQSKTLDSIQQVVGAPPVGDPTLW